MNLLWIVGLALAVVFSVSSATYLVAFEMRPANTGYRLVTGTVLGLAILLATLAVGIIIVWPPHLPL